MKDVMAFLAKHYSHSMTKSHIAKMTESEQSNIMEVTGVALDGSFIIKYASFLSCMICISTVARKKSQKDLSVGESNPAFARPGQ